MINLLPRERRKEIRAAYSNTLLLRYLLLLLGALGFLLIALGITYFALFRAAAQADVTREDNEQRATGYTETQTVATKFRSDLTSAKTLFDEEVRYSLVLMRFSQLLPEGTAADSLSLTSGSFSQPSSMAIRVRNESAAKRLYANFSASEYVSDVSLGNINTTGNSDYPYSVELTFTFNRSISL